MWWNNKDHLGSFEEHIYNPGISGVHTFVGLSEESPSGLPILSDIAWYIAKTLFEKTKQNYRNR